jgi:hypothetical protein
LLALVKRRGAVVDLVEQLGGTAGPQQTPTSGKLNNGRSALRKNNDDEQPSEVFDTA